MAVSFLIRNGNLDTKKFTDRDCDKLNQLYERYRLPLINSILSSEIRKEKQCLKVSHILQRFRLGRYTEIERENRILLEKMSSIMQSTKPKLYNPSMHLLVIITK